VTEVKIEKVLVPVMKPCIGAADLPVRPVPTPVDPKAADTRQLAAALAADVIALDHYAARADAILRICAGVQ